MTVTVYLAWNYSQAKPDPHARAHLARTVLSAVHYQVLCLFRKCETAC